MMVSPDRSGMDDKEIPFRVLVYAVFTAMP